MIYRPLFRQYGQQYGVDPGFLEAIASGGERSLAHEVSSKGATGVMQVLPGTAAPYGGGDLTRPEVSIERAAQYVADLQKKFPGRPDLVAAAYFTGPGAIQNGQVPNRTDRITRAPQYVQNVMQRYQALQGQNGAPAEQRVAGSGAPTPSVEETLRLTGLDAERTRLETLMQGYEALGQSGRITTKEGRAELDKRIDNARQALTQTETRITTLQERGLKLTQEQRAVTKEEREGRKETTPQLSDNAQTLLFALHGVTPTQATQTQVTDVDKILVEREVNKSAQQQSAAEGEKAIPLEAAERLAVPYGTTFNQLRGGAVTPRDSVPRPAASGEERKAYREVTSSLKSAQVLLEGVKKSEVRQVLGALFSDNPDAALAQLLQGRSAEAMTPEQRKYLARMAYTVGILRRDLLGASQTISELKNTAEFLPTKGEIPEAVEAKLEALIEELTSQKANFEQTMSNFGVRPPAGAGGKPSTLSPAAQSVQDQFRRP